MDWEKRGNGLGELKTFSEYKKTYKCNCLFLQVVLEVFAFITFIIMFTGDFPLPPAEKLSIGSSEVMSTPVH